MPGSVREVFHRLLSAAAALLCWLAPAVAFATPQPQARYEIRASLQLAAPQIQGTVTVDFTNQGQRRLDEIVVVLFPNRFSEPEDGINDFNRALVYPEQEFDPGYMEILEARAAGELTPVLPLPHAAGPRGCFVRIPIAPLSPGETRRLNLRFRTTVPHRFGSFGEFDGQLTLMGGWYPYIAAVDAEGKWRLEAPPLADFRVELSASPEIQMVLNGRQLTGAPETAAVTVPSVHYLSLVAAAELIREERLTGETRVVFFHRPPRRAWRWSEEPKPAEIMLSALRDIIGSRPPAVGKSAAELVLVEAPLRLNLTAPGEGAVVVSDRAFKVHWLLRPFHELQLAQAVYAEALRPGLSAREAPADYWWVSEGLSRLLAARFMAQARPGTRSVQDWIELFNIFAIVDRFESSPKIPFVDAFFEKARVADPLHAEIATFNSVLPPGRVILGKLRELLGQNEFDSLVDRCAGAVEPFRRCLSANGNLDWVVEQWLQPYPALNYRLGDTALNQRQSGAFHHRLTIRRQSSRPITEPVTVRLRTIGGHDADIRWDGRGDEVRLTGETTRPVWQAVIDPQRQLIEDRRDDNAQPPTPQIVLDTAEVEISSTEFGVSGLVVGRGRYDYRQDAAVGGFYTNRSLGFTAGGRRHWGAPIDATSFRQNLYAFYGFQALNGGFTEARYPVRTSGQLASVGVRYDYTNVFSFDNPSAQRQLRLYADWYDRGLGGDYSYVDWGISAIGTYPLWTHRTIGAAQVLNGFSEPLGGGVVPNQGRYSLGGSRSIRGIGAEEELARNIALLRTELRQEVYPEVDLNLLDMLVLRRAQVRMFVETGRVSNSAGQIYDVGGYAVGVGTALAAVYEFMGFFPAVAYIEIATRVDDPSRRGDMQFLFGTRQAF